MSELCPKCGKELELGSAFCNACGEKIERTVLAELDDNKKENIGELLTKLIQAKKYAVEMYNCAGSIADLIEKEKRIKDATTKNPVVKGIGCAIVSIVSIVFACKYFNNANDTSILGIISNGFFKLMGTGSIIIALIFIGMLIFYIYQQLVGVKKSEQELNDIQQRIHLAEKELDNLHLRSDMLEPYCAYTELFRDWLSPDEVEYLISVFNTGRADNLKEALLLLDEKKHREEMERAAFETQLLLSQIFTKVTYAANAATDAAASARSAASEAQHTASIVQNK